MGLKDKLSIEHLQELAKKHNGKCLSTEYINMLTKYEWECDKGHQWMALPSHIKYHNTWCPYCSGNRSNLERLNKLAQEHNGKCLSTEYINSRIAYEWECEQGHKFTRTASEINAGRWCSACAKNNFANNGKKYSIEDMQKIAGKHNGKCLSSEYIGILSKLYWQCEKGHIWETTPRIVLQNHWCPECSKEKIGRKQKYSISYFKLLAKTKNGECLSSEYKSVISKLTWKCSEGHIWQTIPNTILRGSWCPECYKQKHRKAK